MKKIIIPLCLAGFGLLMVSACMVCFQHLDTVPHGFHVDEMSSAVDVGCMATEGVDAHGTAHPLFSDMNYGTPKPPTYIYPAILWSRFFGFSVPSLRAFSVMFYFLGIAGLFLWARLLFGWRCALLTAAVASLSPWTWIFARTAFESLFAMIYLIWGLYFFFRRPGSINSAVAAFFFAAAMYSYPPFRLQIPLMFIPLVLYSWHGRPRRASSWTAFAAAFVLADIPLLSGTLRGNLQARFDLISIFSKDYMHSIGRAGTFKDVLEVFIGNYLSHFNVHFLFLNGDRYMIHSTERFGLLSWMDMLALGAALFWILMLLFKKSSVENPLAVHRHLIGFLIANIFIGLIPSSLTTNLPNSLRIVCCWPFMALLSGFLLWQACERWWVLWPALLGLSIFFAVSMFKVYFDVYPQESRGAFSCWVLDQANQTHTDQDWLRFVATYRYQDYYARYFLMAYKGVSCSESQRIWQGVREYLKARGELLSQ